VRYLSIEGSTEECRTLSISPAASKYLCFQNWVPVYMKSRFVCFLNVSDQPLLPVKGSVFDASSVPCFLIPHINLQLLLFKGRACRITVLYTVNKKRENSFHFNNVRPSCIYSCYLSMFLNFIFVF